MKAAIYARVSTIDKQNPELQVATLKEYAARRGYYTDQSLIYIDRASGKNDSRPRFQEMMKDAQKGRFQVVLLTKIDRMMRSLSNLLNIMNDLERWGVMVECSDQNIETRSAQGRLFLQILGAFAEWEREIIAERVQAGIDDAKRRGVKLGRPRSANPSTGALRVRRHRARVALQNIPPVDINTNGGK